jgi:hypothetical protein
LEKPLKDLVESKMSLPDLTEKPRKPKEAVCYKIRRFRLDLEVVVVEQRRKIFCSTTTSGFVADFM